MSTPEIQDPAEHGGYLGGGQVLPDRQPPSKRGVYIALACAVVVALAAIGSSIYLAANRHQAAAHPKTSVQAASSPSPAATHSASKAVEQANARTLIGALAAGTSFEMKQAADTVAGPVMTRYADLQRIEDATFENSGTPGEAGQVAALGKGRYQICYGDQGCQTFSDFTFGGSGRVTGMSVDGQPVAGRIAAGPVVEGGGVLLSEVSSYRSTGSAKLAVTFRLKNTGNSDVSSTGFQVTFTTKAGVVLQPDYQDSTVNLGDMQPKGQSAELVAYFDTRALTGTFKVSSYLQNTLVSSELKTIRP